MAADGRSRTVSFNTASLSAKPTVSTLDFTLSTAGSFPVSGLMSIAHNPLSPRAPLTKRCSTIIR